MHSLEIERATSDMLKFVLLVNKQGQTRLSQYYGYVPVEERVITEADIVRKCLSRSEEAVSLHLLLQCLLKLSEIWSYTPALALNSFV